MPQSLWTPVKKQELLILKHDPTPDHHATSWSCWLQFESSCDANTTCFPKYYNKLAVGLHFYQSQGYLCPKEKKTVKCYLENWPQCSSNDLERAWRRLQTESGSSLSYCTLSRWRHTIGAKTRFSFWQAEVPSSETSKFTVAIYDVAFSSLKPTLFTGFSTFY